MEPRNRILAALDHVETERVPVDIGSYPGSTISVVAYRRLREYLGFEPRPVRISSVIMQVVVPDDDILDRFGVDAVDLGRISCLNDADWVEWAAPDGTPCLVPVWAVPERGERGWLLRSPTGRIKGEMPEGTPYFESAYFPWAEHEPDLGALAEAMAECMWSTPIPPGPLPVSEEGDRLLSEGARRLRASTDRAVVGFFGGNLLEWGEFLCRMDNFLALLAAEPLRAGELLERLTEMHLANLEHYLKLVGPYIDVIVFNDDLGAQNGPLLSPRMFRALFKERYRRLFSRAKELADVRVMLHSCGSIRALLPDLIEAGMEAVNPVQISAGGMEAEALKRDFGPEVTFWGGGCDTQWLLSHGEPKEIREHVARQVEILRQGGGFVFQQVHNILADVPPENIVAMLDTALQS